MEVACAPRGSTSSIRSDRETLGILRNDYGGVGSEGWDMATLGFHTRRMYKSGDLWSYSTVGDEAEVRRRLALSAGAVDTPFTGETPLIGACRSGHVGLVRLLVDGGASGAVLDGGGRGPLHYLGAFDTEDMRDIARRLVAAGASLEPWCWRSSDISREGAGLDYRYGLAGGTPLLWAVQANCREAVEVLLELGAMTFPQRPAGRTGRHFSPVRWAARMHQSEMLDMLLSSVGGGTTVAEMLNSALEESQEGTGPILPIGLAASQLGGLVFARILLHGSDHIEQCFKTAHRLLDAGASVERVTEGGLTALHIAAGYIGPPYGLGALLAWENGRYRPDLADWAESVSSARVHEDQPTFDELLALDVVTDEEYTWPSILAEAALRTDNTHYINAIITKHQEVDTTQADYSEPFRNAWWVVSKPLS